jgi:hypothetical protein
MPVRPTPPPAECAQCGGDIPRKAKACPHCGADERTGWRESSVYDGMDLPDEAWDEGDDSNRSGGAAEGYDPNREKASLPWYWAAVALALILALVLFVTGTL